MFTLALICISLGWALIGLHARRWGEVSVHDLIYLLTWPVTVPLGFLISVVGDKIIWERDA